MAPKPTAVLVAVLLALLAVAPPSTAQTPGSPSRGGGAGSLVPGLPPQTGRTAANLLIARGDYAGALAWATVGADDPRLCGLVGEVGRRALAAGDTTTVAGAIVALGRLADGPGANPGTGSGRGSGGNAAGAADRPWSGWCTVALSQLRVQSGDGAGAAEMLRTLLADLDGAADLTGRDRRGKSITALTLASMMGDVAALRRLMPPDCRGGTASPGPVSPGTASPGTAPVTSTAGTRATDPEAADQGASGGASGGAPGRPWGLPCIALWRMAVNQAPAARLPAVIDAMLLDLPPSLDAVRAYVSAAGRLTDLDDPRRALDILRRARQVVGSVPLAAGQEARRDDMVARLAFAFAEAGDVGTARDLVVALAPERRGEALTGVARALVREGMASQADGLLAYVGDPADRAELLADMASAALEDEAAAGADRNAKRWLDAARSLAATLPADQREATLQALAVGDPAGVSPRLADARRRAALLPDDPEQALDILGDLAVLEVREGDVERGVAAARESLAIAAASDAQGTAQRNADRRLRRAAQRTVGELMAAVLERDGPAGLAPVLTLAGDPAERERLLAGAASRMLRTGDDGEARQILAQLSDPALRAGVQWQMDVAAGLVRPGG